MSNSQSVAEVGMKTSTWRLIGWVLGASLVLTACGCVKVKKISIVVKLDQPNDSIAILVAQEGFYDDTSLVEKNATAMEAELAETKKNLAEFTTKDRTIPLFVGGDGVELDPKPDDKENTLRIKRRFAKLVEVKPGTFLLNRQGELSGYQKVAIPRAKDFAKALNETISEDLKANDLSSNDLAPLSKASVRLIEEAAAKGHDWLRFEEGRIVLDVPLTRDDAELVLAKKETDKKLLKMLETLREVVGDFRIARSRDGLEIVFGDEKTRVLTLTIPEEKHSPAFERELLEFARELPGAFDKSQDMQTFIGKLIATP